MQQQLATATDPAVIAQLQAQLAHAGGAGQAVQAQAAAVQAQGRGAGAARRGAGGPGQRPRRGRRGADPAGRALRRQAAALTAQGGALARRGAALRRRRRRALRAPVRRLRHRAARAPALKDELVRMLTKAGGEPRATDPRLVRLQDALRHAPGVVSVSPPRVNKAGTAAMFTVTPATRPADPLTAALVQRAARQP